MDLDLAVGTTPLKEAESIKASLAREAVNYYDDFHLSPLKVRRDGWEEIVWEGMGPGSHQGISG